MFLRLDIDCDLVGLATIENIARLLSHKLIQHPTETHRWKIIIEPELSHRRTLVSGSPTATFHRESTQHTGFLSAKVRDRLRVNRASRADYVAYQEVHWKVELQSPALCEAL